MYVEARKKLVEWLRSQLIGPAGEGVLRMTPMGGKTCRHVLESKDGFGSGRETPPPSRWTWWFRDRRLRGGQSVDAGEVEGFNLYAVAERDHASARG